MKRDEEQKENRPAGIRRAIFSPFPLLLQPDLKPYTIQSDLALTERRLGNHPAHFVDPVSARAGPSPSKGAAASAWYGAVRLV